MSSPVLLGVSAVVTVLFGLIGIRLILVGVRARSAAEALIGGGLLLSPGGVAAIRYGVVANAHVVHQWGTTAVVAGMSLIVLFTYMTFRPGERRYLAFALLDIVLLWVGFADQWQRGFGHGDASALLLFARAIGHGWGAWEAWRFRTMYRRRLAIGLADPVIVNRFTLFVLWFGILAVAEIAMGVGRVTVGTPYWIVTHASPFVAVASAALMWLIFMPPRAYVDFIGRSGEPTGEGVG